MQPSELETGRFYYARRLTDGQIDILWCHGARDRPRLSSPRSHAVAADMYEVLGLVPEWVERGATA